MRLENVSPVNSSGIPLLLAILGFLLNVLGLQFLPHPYSTICELIGWFLIFASWGKDILITDTKVILRYAFGFLKIEIEDINEITNLSELNRAMLIKYFKGEILIPMIFISNATLTLLNPPSKYPQLWLIDTVMSVYWTVIFLIVFVFPIKKLKKHFVTVVSFTVFLLPLLFWTFHLFGIPFRHDDVMFHTFLGAIFGPWFIWEFVDNRKRYLLVKSNRHKYLLVSVDGNTNEVVKTLLRVTQNAQTT